jgi:hypothetical protein
MSASGICPQRRICSRRAPSHVVRLQSIPSVFESSVGIVAFPGTKLLNVRPILRSIGFFVCELLHRDRNDGSVTQGGEGGERSLYVVRDQLNDDIDIFREQQISVRADRQSPATR